MCDGGSKKDPIQPKLPPERATAPPKPDPAQRHRECHCVTTYEQAASGTWATDRPLLERRLGGRLALVLMRILSVWISNVDIIDDVPELDGELSDAFTLGKVLKHGVYNNFSVDQGLQVHILDSFSGCGDTSGLLATRKPALIIVNSKLVKHTVA